MASTTGSSPRSHPRCPHTHTPGRRCDEWATAGECENNKHFMVGGETHPVGKCRVACKACAPCAKGDWGCINKARAALGYLEIEEPDLVKALS